MRAVPRRQGLSREEPARGRVLAGRGEVRTPLPYRPVQDGDTSGRFHTMARIPIDLDRHLKARAARRTRRGLVVGEDRGLAGGSVAAKAAADRGSAGHGESLADLAMGKSQPGLSEGPERTAGAWQPLGGAARVTPASAEHCRKGHPPQGSGLSKEDRVVDRRGLRHDVPAVAEAANHSSRNWKRSGRRRQRRRRSRRWDRRRSGVGESEEPGSRKAKGRRLRRGGGCLRRRPAAFWQRLAAETEGPRAWWRPSHRGWWGRRRSPSVSAPATGLMVSVLGRGGSGRRRRFMPLRRHW